MFSACFGSSKGATTLLEVEIVVSKEIAEAQARLCKGEGEIEHTLRSTKDKAYRKVQSLHKKIAKEYLSGWFMLDLCSTVPFDIIVPAFVPDLTTSAGAQT